jgi:type 2 lantibiotic biosynthesis protein LanM
MDSWCEQLLVSAATIDELLSDEFEILPGLKRDADAAARRLAAWCRSASSGDWDLFHRRLKRDGLTLRDVLKRFATVQRNPSVPPPRWLQDSRWIVAALQTATKPVTHSKNIDHFPFEDLFIPVVQEAERMLRTAASVRGADRLNDSAWQLLRRSLLKELSSLSAPALYEVFDKSRKPNEFSHVRWRNRRSFYRQFIADMKVGGFRLLFENKPVLLRLIATKTRQWIEVSSKLICRLEDDMRSISSEILDVDATGSVVSIEGGLSDPHNGGQSVLIVTFENTSRVVYKPKDLKVDVAWYELITNLNRSGASIQLKVPRSIARDGYGWTEYIEHTGCTDSDGCARFFQRIGAWLALFHFFAATDIHQENMIAASDHPVPIDLETILQTAPQEYGTQGPEAAAFDAATEIVNNTVMMVGLLPAYGRSPKNEIFAVGGVVSRKDSEAVLAWNNMNSDGMYPVRKKRRLKPNHNLPHINGQYTKFSAHISDVIEGFETYAKFVLERRREEAEWQFDAFSGIPVRKVIRATRFYYMLLQRLRDHRTMNDAVIWSAQADFVARLADWESAGDSTWPLLRAERSALLALDVPYFMSTTDGQVIQDLTGHAVRVNQASGMDRARSRIQGFDERELTWQLEVIRQNTGSLERLGGLSDRLLSSHHVSASDGAIDAALLAEADTIAKELSRYAIRRGPNAAWIGLEGPGDSEVSQLVSLGPDLYNGVSGIGLFLAAHAAVAQSTESEELALAAVSYLRKTLRSRNAARVARLLGVGGGTGLGSIVYAFASMAKHLGDTDVLADAHVAARLITDELIEADRALDVIGGSAGAILALLRLHHDSESDEVLRLAVKLGEHLLRQPRIGPKGRRSWIGEGAGERPLTGISHGAAGFAYALGSLAAITGREDFRRAGSECIAFENSTYNAARRNWPDLRDIRQPAWTCQWCYGAPGIGLARIAMIKGLAFDRTTLENDVANAVRGTKKRWPNSTDTLCCGTFGGIEFLREAGDLLQRPDIEKLALQRLLSVLDAARSAGDYRWNAGKRQFNLGLFRGLAGAGYTVLRWSNRSLPNILMWE